MDYSKRKKPGENSGSYRGITWKDNFDLSKQLFMSPSDATNWMIRHKGTTHKDYIDHRMKDMTYEEYRNKMLLEKKINNPPELKINISTGQEEIDHIDISGDLKSEVIIKITFRK